MSGFVYCEGVAFFDVFQGHVDIAVARYYVCSIGAEFGKKKTGQGGERKNEKRYEKEKPEPVYQSGDCVCKKSFYSGDITFSVRPRVHHGFHNQTVEFPAEGVLRKVGAAQGEVSRGSSVGAHESCEIIRGGEGVELLQFLYGFFQSDPGIFTFSDEFKSVHKGNIR